MISIVIGVLFGVPQESTIAIYCFLIYIHFHLDDYYDLYQLAHMCATVLLNCAVISFSHVSISCVLCRSRYMSVSFHLGFICSLDINISNINVCITVRSLFYVLEQKLDTKCFHTKPGQIDQAIQAFDLLYEIGVQVKPDQRCELPQVVNPHNICEQTTCYIHNQNVHFDID